jgi:hypothetical protein
MAIPVTAGGQRDVLLDDLPAALDLLERIELAHAQCQRFPVLESAGEADLHCCTGEPPIAGDAQLGHLVRHRADGGKLGRERGADLVAAAVQTRRVDIEDGRLGRIIAYQFVDISVSVARVFSIASIAATSLGALNAGGGPLVAQPASIAVQANSAVRIVFMATRIPVPCA